MISNPITLNMFKLNNNSILKYKVDGGCNTIVISKNKMYLNIVLKTMVEDIISITNKKLIKGYICSSMSGFYENLSGIRFKRMHIGKKIKKIIKILRSINKVMNKRYNRLKQKSIFNVSDYNKKALNGEKNIKFMTYQVLIIDNIENISTKDKLVIDELMIRITQRSRAVGIIVFIFSDNEISNSLSLTKYNLINKIIIDCYGEISIKGDDLIEFKNKNQ